jgi:hypothetical protein
VTQHTDIQERELIKLAALARAISKALHARGVSEPHASISAEAGSAIFKIGFERWLSEKKPRDFAAHIRSAAGALEEMTSGGKATRPKKKAVRRA